MSMGQHLSAEEIDWLITEQSLASGTLGPSDLSLEEAERHVNSCDMCSERMDSAKKAEQLNRLLQSISSRRSDACPVENEWFRTVAGTAPTEQVLSNLRHAAQCDYCGQLLREAMADFSGELTDEESLAIANLSTSQPEHQLKLANKLMQGSERQQKMENHSVAGGGSLRWPAWARWSVATAAAAVVISVAWFVMSSMRPASPDRLLAEAYSQQRTLEFRFPGASHSVMRVERGSRRSRLDRPVSLLEAEAQIKSQLDKHPGDAHWLEAKARADLLNGDYPSAIESLNRALESQPESPALMADLATAYFQRAESEDRPMDFGESIEMLSRALAKEPDNPVFLFNRAIAAERIYLYEQAIGDWQHYLRVDPGSDWAQEARERLNKLEQKRKKHDDAASKPLLTPEQIVKSRNTDQRGTWTEMDARVEQYLDTAIRDWLPQAFPARSGRHPPDQNARTALSLLSDILEQNHKDVWLKDLLAETSGPTFSTAVEALSKAVQLNAVGDPENARVAAEKAAGLFAGNEPGKLRAEVEQVYSLHRSLKGNECLRAAIPLSKRIQPGSYPWIYSQLMLEQSLCWGAVGQLERSLTGLGMVLRARDLTTFPVLNLRALGLMASVQTEMGDIGAVWKTNIGGLASYWSGNSPPLRAYQFYSNLSFSLAYLDQKQLAFVLCRESLSSIRKTGKASDEAMMHFRLAEAALRVNREADAEEEFRQSSNIFSTLPQNETRRVYQMGGDIALARLEARHGALKESFAHFSQLRPVLAKTSNYTLPLSYYLALAEVQQINKDPASAERALWAAANIGESALSSLHTDRDRLSWNREMASVYRDLVMIKLQAGQGKEALEIWEWFRSAALRFQRTKQNSSRASRASLGIDFGNLDRSVPKVDSFTPENLAALKRTTVISYAQMPSGLAIWIADDRGIQSTWIPVPEPEVRRITRQFVRDCSTPDSNISDLKRHGRKLYEWLIAPIKPYLQNDRVLVFEPDAPFSDISVQALVDEHGKYFGESFPIAYSFGLEYLQQLHKAAHLRKSARAFIVGPPALNFENGGEWESLPDASEEAEAVAGRFRSAALITGRDATASAVEMGLKDAQVFHFAGHALGTAAGAELLVAKPTPNANETSSKAAYLGSEKLSTLPLNNLQLAVLSACSTAKDDGRGGADPSSLVYPFVRARVPNVVASRWQVDSKNTSNFMKTFYTSLLANSTASRALQIAELELKSKPASEHPYYWASFGVFGRE